MTEHRSPIPARVYNAAVGGHVCGPEDVDFGQKVVHLIKYDKDGNEISFESQITQTNKIYIIHDDFVLSSNVTVPANCVLKFDGGSISGAYTLIGTNTGIDAGLVKIFNTDITLAGTWNIIEVYPEWFGAKGDGVVDDSNFIEKAINFSTSAKSIYVYLTNLYYISRTVNVYKSLNLKGGHVIDPPFNNLSNVQASPESCIIIANNVTAFNLIGIPENDNGRFATLNIYGIKVIGSSRNKTENFIIVNAFNYPSRYSVIKDCEFTLLNKVINYNISDHYDLLGYSMAGLNIENVYCYFANNFIYALDEVGNKPSICNLHVKDSAFEYMTGSAFKIYDLFGPNIIENCQFEEDVTPIDVLLMEGSTLTLKSNYITQITGDCIKVQGQDRPADFGKAYVSIFDNVLVSTLTAWFFRVNIVNGQDLNKFNSCSLNYCAIDSKYTNLPIEWIAEEGFIIVTGKYDKPILKPQITINASLTEKEDGFLGGFGSDWDNTVLRQLQTVYDISKINIVAFYKDDNYTTTIVSDNHGSGFGGNIHTKTKGVVIVRPKFGQYDGYINARHCSYEYSAEDTIWASQDSVFLDVGGCKICDISASKIGDDKFDETSNKPIYWTGTEWVDATGTSV